jgi:hypothetical protein
MLRWLMRIAGTSPASLTQLRMSRRSGVLTALNASRKQIAIDRRVSGLPMMAIAGPRCS